LASRIIRADSRHSSRVIDLCDMEASGEEVLKEEVRSYANDVTLLCLFPDIIAIIQDHSHAPVLQEQARETFLEAEVGMVSSGNDALTEIDTLRVEKLSGCLGISTCSVSVDCHLKERPTRFEEKFDVRSQLDEMSERRGSGQERRGGGEEGIPQNESVVFKLYRLDLIKDLFREGVEGCGVNESAVQI
jgi:hypothetical protein